MASSDVVEAMRLALKPFNIQNLADDWAAQAAEKMLITSMSTLQFVTDVESEAWANLFALLPDPPVPVAARAVIGASLKKVLSGDGDGHAGGGDGKEGRGGNKRKADEVETTLSTSTSLGRYRANARYSKCMYFLLGAALMLKFWKNPAGLSLPLPTYLPAYLPTLLMGN